MVGESTNIKSSKDVDNRPGRQKTIVLGRKERAVRAVAKIHQHGRNTKRVLK